MRAVAISISEIKNFEDGVVFMGYRDQALAAAKQTVLSHHHRVDNVPSHAIGRALSIETSADCLFQFTAPFDGCIGAEDASKNFWCPLRDAFSPLQRRPDIFFAGHDSLNRAAKNS